MVALLGNSNRIIITIIIIIFFLFSAHINNLPEALYKIIPFLKLTTGLKEYSGYNFEIYPCISVSAMWNDENFLLRSRDKSLSWWAPGVNIPPPPAYFIFTYLISTPRSYLIIVLASFWVINVILQDAKNHVHFAWGYPWIFAPFNFVFLS